LAILFMLFILNKIFFNNFIVTPHAFTSLRLQSSSLPLPRSLDDEITDFECESENTPDVDELTDMGNNTPKGIRDVSDKEIEKVEDTAAKLLEKIEDEQVKGNIQDEEAEEYRSRVDRATTKAISDIEETNDVAVDCIDDTSDTEDLLFGVKEGILPLIIVSELPLIKILSVLYTLYNLNLFSIFYNQILYYIYK
jgi:ElaB/YqjD/DUF883 family membrane-anchored ribosome-binding protein